MQLDFTPGLSDPEKLALLMPYHKTYVLLVVLCGRYMIKHMGRLVDFDESGKMLALDGLNDRHRFMYNNNDFEQIERKQGNAKDRWQYIPLVLISKIIVN